MSQEMNVAESKYERQFQQALDAVLAIDPALAEIVAEHEFPSFLAAQATPPASSFEYLVKSVISQQVSGYAARAITNRFKGLYADQFPTPAQLLATPADELRTAGLSMRKAEYVHGIARAYEDGLLSCEQLRQVDDDEAVDRIVALKGMGPWSAQMFLLFWLKRMDVFSPSDIGVQRGFRRYLATRPELLKQVVEYDPEDPRYRSPGTCKKARQRPPIPADLKAMEAIASRFSPNRSAFQLILWKLSDIVMDTVELRAGGDAKSTPKTKASKPKTPKTRAPKTKAPNTEATKAKVAKAKSALQAKTPKVTSTEATDPADTLATPITESDAETPEPEPVPEPETYVSPVKRRKR